jgi:hypothetical protein
MRIVNSVGGARLAILVLLACTGGCGARCQRDLVRIVTPDGSVHQEYEERNGIKDGLYIEYVKVRDAGRRIKFLGEFKQGKESGTWIRFSDLDGGIESMWHMNGGKPIGSAVFFGRIPGGAGNGRETTFLLSATGVSDWLWDEQGVPKAKSRNARIFVREQGLAQQGPPMHLPHD